MNGVGDVFQHDGGFQCVARGFADSERAVIREQHGGGFADVFEDGSADVVAVIIDVGDAGDFGAEFVGDGGQEDGDRFAKDGETGGVIGVGVDDAADVGAVVVQVKMMGGRRRVCICCRLICL